MQSELLVACHVIPLARIREKWGMTFEEGRLLEAAKTMAAQYYLVVPQQHQFPPEAMLMRNDNMWDGILREIEKRFPPSPPDRQFNDIAEGLLESYTRYRNMINDHPLNG